MLEPLIYIIYVNDIVTLLYEEYNFFLYADDMLIIHKHENVQNVVEGL